MKKSELIQKIKEVLAEMSMTGTGASFTPGSGEQYATAKAFSKKGQGKNAATKQGERLGLKVVKRPKHPSHTKMFDYLNETDGGNFEAPFAFTTDEGLYTHDGVKISEKLGMEVADKSKKIPAKKAKASKKSDIK
jgi:hypothetical protein